MSAALDPNDLDLNNIDFDSSEASDVGPIGPLDVLRYVHAMDYQANKLKGDVENPLTPFGQRDVQIAAEVCAEMDTIEQYIGVIPSKYDPGVKMNVPFELLALYRAMMYKFIAAGDSAASTGSWYKLGFYLSFITLMVTWLILLIK